MMTVKEILCELKYIQFKYHNHYYYLIYDYLKEMDELVNKIEGEQNGEEMDK